MVPSNPVRALFYTLGLCCRPWQAGGKEECLPLRPEYLSLEHVVLPLPMLLSKVPRAVYTRSQLRLHTGTRHSTLR